jgi:circadian clock protein KaiC
MAKATITPKDSPPTLPKALTGIQGLDEITGGGLPRGRPTLVCGSAGSGKTLLAMEFLVRGAIECGRPGVFMAFEETAGELAQNVRSLGFDLDDLAERKLLVVDYVRVERSEIEETGEYDLEGLFVRLGCAIDTLGAKRVVLDTIETLFSGLSCAAVLRAELRCLFRWLKDRGITAVITGERSNDQLTGQGLEEYVSDCVILLDHRVIDQVSTRRIRNVKYRGTTHGTNEYPFLIDEDGISVLPITSLGLQHQVSNERIPTGIDRLDAMLGGEGYFRASTVLVSGTAGSGKSSVAAHFVHAACRRVEKCLYFSFEESPSQIIRNMRSIGIDLEPWVKKGLLHFHAIRSTLYGLEMHLAAFHKLIQAIQPRVVVVDPIGSLIQAGSRKDANATLTRLIDFLKVQEITALMTNLTSGDENREKTEEVANESVGQSSRAGKFHWNRGRAGCVGTAAMRRRAIAEIHRRLRQPQEAVRGTSAGPLQDRSHRSHPASAIGGGRPDRGDSDPGAEASRTAAQDRRRPFEHRTHAGGVAVASGKPSRLRSGPNEKAEVRHHRGI